MKRKKVNTETKVNKKTKTNKETQIKKEKFGKVGKVWFKQLGPKRRVQNDGLKQSG